LNARTAFRSAASVALKRTLQVPRSENRSAQGSLPPISSASVVGELIGQQILYLADIR
jgi:hypothetical protein